MPSLLSLMNLRLSQSLLQVTPFLLLFLSPCDPYTCTLCFVLIPAPATVGDNEEAI